jgi:CHRD domain
MRVHLLLATTAFVVAGFVAVPGAQAQTKAFHADLTTAQEVPPVAGAATGKGTFTLDPATKQLTWSVTYGGLSSDATAAHIHGPAAPGANAGVAINLAPNGMKSPLTGSATLTDAQIADLTGGKYYTNVHTAQNKSGEIRGQILP